MIDTLLDLASKRPRVHKARVCAALVSRKGLIVSIGFNSLKTHPKAAKWHRQALRAKECIHIHAECRETRQEMDAILRASNEGFQGFSSSVLYVARSVKIGNSPEYVLKSGLALPCEACVCAIQEYSIPRVVFTTDNQTLGELTL